MPQENYFEIGVSRHAPKEEKKGETVDVRNQDIDKESAQQEIAERTKFLLENLEKAPTGAIMALEPSNVKRAEQTRDLFADNLKVLLEQRKDIELVELGDNEEKAEALIERIKSEPGKKFIISDLRGTWLIGFKNDESYLPAVNKWKNKLKGDESMLGKVWAAHKIEILELVEELKKKGIDCGEEEINQQEFETTPEEQAIRFLKWVKSIKKIGESHFPDRPLILEAISHNMRSDYTTLALLGEDISLESINRVLGGEFRKPFERSSILFGGDSSVQITYRDIQKRYSEEDLEKIIESLPEKVAIRKREWRS